MCFSLEQKSSFETEIIFNITFSKTTKITKHFILILLTNNHDDVSL